VLRGLPEIPLKGAAGIVETVTADPIDLLGDVVGLFQPEGAEPNVFEDAAVATREYISSVTAGDPDTVTGEVAQQMGNFVAAFVPILGQLGKAKQATSTAGKIAQTRIGKDAIAGFIADFLTADTPDEDAFRTRLSQAGIGAVAGVGLDSTVQFLRSVRAAKRLRSGKSVSDLEGVAPRITEEASRITGDASAPLVSKRKDISQKRLKDAQAEVEARFGLSRPAFHGTKSGGLIRQQGLEIGAGDYNGFYFTDIPEDAARWADNWAKGEGPSEVIEFSIDLRNPARISDVENAKLDLGMGWTPAQLTKRLKREGFDGVIDVNETVVFDKKQVFPAGASLPSKMRQMAELETTDVTINFDRIDTIDDVERLMQDTTNLFKPSVDDARRGVRTNEATKITADQLGVSTDDLLSFREGQNLNAEEAVAFRKLWGAAAEKTEELARVAADLNSGVVDQMKFRRSLAIFNAINQRMLGARAEAGRALQSWSIKVGNDGERARLISELIDANGGSEVSTALARRIVAARDMGMTPAQISKIAERGWGARTLDAVKESFVLGLLWTPSTHMVNLTSNTIVPLQQMAERALARQIGRVLGDVPGEGVAPGEALAMGKGILKGIRAAFHISAQGKPLREQVDVGLLNTRNKLDIRRRAISSEAFGLHPDDGLGKFVDFVGSTIRLPGAALRVEDDVYKTVGFAAELETQAVRQATKEGVDSGWDATKIAKRAGELASNPPENIKLASVDAALYNTFQQNVGGFGRALMQLREAAPPAILALPFVRTPMNLLRYTFERSPMAPLVRQWRAEVKAGGARAEIALARMAVGTATFAAMLDYAYEGHLSGPASREPGIREARMRQGLQPDSVRFGDHTFKINRVDPFGLQLSVAAGIAELMKVYQVEAEDIPELSEIIGAAAVMSSDAILDKTWFSGASDMISFMQYPERRGPKFIERKLQGLVPFFTGIKTVSQIAETTRPDVAGWLYVESLVDGFAATLPRRRDLWGRPIQVDVVNVFSPARIVEVKENPIDTEILRLDASIQRITRTGSFQGVPINFRAFPKVYETYVELSGNGIDHPATGLGAFDFLQDFVSGNHAMSTIYDSPIMTDDRKEAEIRSWIADYRQLAQREIMEDPDGRFQGTQFDEFRRVIEDKQQQAREALIPGGLQ
jgi:hypothetical protein